MVYFVSVERSSKQSNVSLQILDCKLFRARLVLLFSYGSIVGRESPPIIQNELFSVVREERSEWQKTQHFVIIGSVQAKKNPTSESRWGFFIDNAEPQPVGMTLPTYFKRMSRIEYYIAGCAYCQD